MGSRVVDPKTGKPGPYVFKKYKEVYTAVKEVAAGIRKLGINAVRFKPTYHYGMFHIFLTDPLNVFAFMFFINSMITLVFTPRTDGNGKSLQNHAILNLWLPLLFTILWVKTPLNTL